MLYELALAPHMHACHLEDQVVLLDLRRSRYFAIPATHSPMLGTCVKGWPAATLGHAAETHERPDDALIRSMLKHGWLCNPNEARGSAGLSRVEQPTTTLDTQELFLETRVSARGIARFLACILRARCNLKCYSMDQVVRRVARRKDRHATASKKFNFEAATREVALYERLRPLAFSAHDKCLVDSLALVEFLAAAQLFPNWVIGVRVHPFVAHSWVQEGQCVLNDAHERVGKFTPILGV